MVIGVEYKVDDCVGSLPSIVYRICVPEMEEVNVKDIADAYLPDGCENVGEVIVL